MKVFQQNSGGFVGSPGIWELFLLLTFGLLGAGFCAGECPAQTLPAETVTGIEQNVDSIKVQFADPTGVAGIADHRAYLDGNGENVKYAGVTVVPNPAPDAGQNGIPGFVDVPTMEIEVNGISRRVKHTVTVEAVDALGPFPIGNETDPLTNLLVDGSDPMSIGNSDAGMTLDGNTSINGQGDPTNVPNVLARSIAVPFTLSGPNPIPSVAGVDPRQEIFEGFGTPVTITKETADGNGDDLYSVAVSHSNNTTVAYDWIEYQTDDTASKPFAMGDHWMECLFDGAPYYEFGGSVMHNNHGLSALSPHKSVNVGASQITHFTFEVDAHNSGRRYESLVLAPSNDAPVNWYQSDGVAFNKSNRGIEFRIDTSTIDATLYNGFAGDGVTPDDLSITGPVASGIQYFVYRTGQGRGLDDRSRFDVYLTQTHWRIYEDGTELYDGDYGTDPLTSQPATLGFTSARTYFAHWMYHSGLGLYELQTYYPWERYFIAHPYGDERHWDDMGFEVLPGSVTWATVDATSMAGVAQSWAEASSYP